MANKKLNLKKIELYCILHNIDNPDFVPDCRNCQYWKAEKVITHRTFVDIDYYCTLDDVKCPVAGKFDYATYFSCDVKLRKFKKGLKGRWHFFACGEWKKFI